MFSGEGEGRGGETRTWGRGELGGVGGESPRDLGRISREPPPRDGRWAGEGEGIQRTGARARRHATAELRLGGVLGVGVGVGAGVGRVGGLCESIVTPRVRVGVNGWAMQGLS